MIHAIVLILLGLSGSHQASTAATSCDPALLPLFTPAPALLGHYEICTGPLPAGADGWHLAPAERLEALDAFGNAGDFNRARLAQLFGGQRVTVVRGWREAANRFESVTVLSPYPDSSLEHLNAGTLVIRWVWEAPSRASLHSASN